MTEKLFYIDSHMTTFSAEVQACEKVGDFYEVVLDRTAFFPMGGGQDADTGVLGNVNVLDVNEREDFIIHTTDGELPVGVRVEGTIDWEQRFSRMQQHTGEHIVSGIVNRKYGYDNVGFHMGSEVITMDYTGVLTLEQLKEIELEANKVVVENLPIISLFPKKEELGNISYRSKKALDGEVRLVEIPGHDRCACCAPQVKNTGEIGIIRLLGLQSYKGGVRVSMLCGFRALEDYYEKTAVLKKLAILTSASDWEIVEEVERLKEELGEKKLQLADAKAKILSQMAQDVKKGTKLVTYFEELEGNEPRELANLLLEKDVEIVAVFSGTEEAGFRYVIGSKRKDVRELSKILNVKFEGRGGGKPEMVQGSLKGNQDKIKEVLENVVL